MDLSILLLFFPVALLTFFLVFSVIWLYIIAFAGLFNRDVKVECPLKKEVLVLVPAYNEEKLISQCLLSLSTAIKPNICDVMVIADNCSDKTAQIAKNLSTAVFERTDPENRGKGQALEWALSNIPIKKYDYVLFLDADNTVSPTIFMALEHAFSAGADAVQTNYILTSKSNGNHFSVLQHIASMVENNLFWKGRNSLNLHVLLRGTGMALSVKLLQNNPWNATGITEDTEYSLSIIQKGYSIKYITSAFVTSQATTSYRQSRSQKFRWANGTLQLIIKYFPQLVKNGILHFNLKILELAFSLLLLSRPSLIYLSIITGIAAQFYPYFFRLPVLGISFVSFLFLLAYILIGVFFIKDKKSVFKAFLHIPFYGIWLLLIQISSLFSSKTADWVRTKRN